MVITQGMATGVGGRYSINEEHIWCFGGLTELGIGMKAVLNEGWIPKDVVGSRPVDPHHNALSDGKCAGSKQVQEQSKTKNEPDVVSRASAEFVAGRNRWTNDG